MKEEIHLMRKLFVFILLVIITYSAQSQVRLGIFGGISNYQGDLVDKPYLHSKGAFGLSLGYQLSNRINLRAGLTFGKIAGADSTNKTDLKQRNLSFQSKITDFALTAEYIFFNMDNLRWSPYVFTGLAIFHFNPYTFDQNNNQVFLQPLSTEGQGIQGYASKPYSLTLLSIPFGGGIKYALSDRIQLGLEAGFRKTFTDYLDDISGDYADPNDLLAAKGQEAVDISYRGDELAGGNPLYPAKGAQRGSPKYKDYYYFTGLHLTFQLGDGGGNGMFSGGKGKKGYGCPKVF